MAINLKTSASTAVQILKEILALELLFPKSERDASLLARHNSVKSSTFNMRRSELLDLMYSFEKKGLIKILDDDISLGTLIKQEYDKNGLPLHQVPFEDENEKNVNYEVIDTDGVKSLIKTLDEEMTFDAGSGNGVEIMNEKHFVTKVQGQYYVNGRPLKIRNDQTKYIQIFNTAYSLEPRGGKISYKGIEDSYFSVYKKRTSKDKILRALTGNSANLLQYVPALRRPDCKLFEAVHDGNYIIFHNDKQ